MTLKESIIKAFAGNTDLTTVTTKLVRAVKKDSVLLDEALKDWAYDVCRTHTRDIRELVWNHNKSGHRDATDRVHALEKAVTETLMNFPLWGGKRLRGATRQEVLESVRHFSVQAQNMEWKAAWLGRVARRLPNNEVTVEKVLTEDQLIELKEKTSTAAAA